MQEIVENFLFCTSKILDQKPPETRISPDSYRSLSHFMQRQGLVVIIPTPISLFILSLYKWLRYIIFYMFIDSHLTFNAKTLLGLPYPITDE